MPAASRSGRPAAAVLAMLVVAGPALAGQEPPPVVAESIERARQACVARGGRGALFSRGEAVRTVTLNGDRDADFVVFEPRFRCQGRPMKPPGRKGSLLVFLSGPDGWRQAWAGEAVDYRITPTDGGGHALELEQRKGEGFSRLNLETGELVPVGLRFPTGSILKPNTITRTGPAK